MNILDDESRNEIVYRLLYGEQIVEIDSELFKIVNPSPKIKVLAGRLYQQTIRENRFGPWMKDRDCLRVLVQQGLCSPQIDSNMKEMDKNIDTLKVDLYELMLREDQLKKTRKILGMTKKKREELLNIRHMLDYTTLAGYAEMVRRQFLMFSTLYYYESGEKVFESWETVEMGLLERALGRAVEQIVPSDSLREVARTEPWRSYWSSSQKEPFRGISAGMLSDEQRAVVLYTQMYDSVSQHPECPPDDVIDDDDMFDGWLIKERRKREKGQMDKQMNDRLGHRHSSADEVFVVAQGESKDTKTKDAARINEMNSTHSKILKAQREKQLKHKGTMVDAEFQDRRLQIQQESNEQFMQNVKKGKK